MYKFHLRLDQVNEGGDGNATGYETPPPEETKSENPTAPEAAGNIDEFGYKSSAPPDESGKKDDSPEEEGKKESEKTPETEEQPDKVTGYDEEPPKVDPPKEETQEEEPPPEDELGYELSAEGMDEKEIEKIKAFAKTHKLSEETAKAFLALKKSEIDSEKAAQAEYQNKLKQAVAAKKAEWHKELKDDPKFGGQNFARNIHKVDKVLNQIMIETKKKLTESKTMLPPYVMRDMAKLHDQLFGTENLVHGDKGDPSKEASAAEDDHLSFYNKKNS